MLGILVLPNFGVNLTYRLFGISIFTECAFRKGPIVQMIGDDRAVIVWEHCREEGDAVLRWGEQEMQVSGIKIAYGKGKKATVYKAFLFGLPAGKGAFEIKAASSNTFRKYSVVIPAINAETLRIAVVGDNQYGKKVFNEILSKISSANPDLFLHVGDMVQRSYQDSDWQDFFFDPLRHAGLTSKIPFIIAQGNHDISENRLAPYFPALRQLSERPVGYYYALTIGNARFIVLDANTEVEAQVTWLEKELKSEKSQKAPFRIVTTHISPFIEYWDPETWNEGESNWPVYMHDRMVPLFEKYHVDLVLSGHQHNYQRGERNDVTYVITGGGGGALDSQQVESLDVYDKTVIEHHFTLLDIDKQSIVVRMRLKDGIIADQFVIKRRR